MKVRLSRIHFPVTTLGPGRRIGVWLQGCSIRCPGCISVDTWDTALGETGVDQVLDAIAGWASHADGLTISGGEPLDQPEALAAILEGWRALARTSVLLFTGYEHSRFVRWQETHPDLVDAVVSGPYVREAGQSLALRGSDNQELYVLSQLGASVRSFERPRTEADRRLDVMFDNEGGAWFAGIPEPGDFLRLRRALAGAGHRTIMSDGSAA